MSRWEARNYATWKVPKGTFCNFSKKRKKKNILYGDFMHFTSKVVGLGQRLKYGEYTYDFLSS